MSRACEFTNCTNPTTRRARRHHLRPVGEMASLERVHTKIRFRRQSMPSVSANVSYFIIGQKFTV